MARTACHGDYRHIRQEPEAERIVRTLVSAPERTLSVANLVEV
jgi:hypothetical protein